MSVKRYTPVIDPGYMGDPCATMDLDPSGEYVSSVDLDHLVTVCNALQSQVDALRTMASAMRKDQNYYGADYSSRMIETDRNKLLEMILHPPADEGKHEG